MKKFVSLISLFSILIAGGFAENADSTLALIAELTDAPGGSGFEGPIRKIIQREFQKLDLETKVDNMGNLYAYRESNSGKPKVLLMAHMDEVAFIIREVSDEGYIFFDQIGWWIDPVIVGQKWVISTPKGVVKGVTGIESSHVLPEYPKIGPVSKHRMFLDIGVRSKEEAEALGVRPGLSFTPDVKFEVLNNTNRYCAKAFDDRIALAAIVKALENLHGVELPCEVTVAATVQEEFIMKGAEAVFASAKPEVVINIEVGIARDFPVHFPNHLSSKPCLGKGPTLFVYDGSMLASNGLVEYFTDLAVSCSIPFQYEAQTINYGHDGCRLQRGGTGTFVINLGIPTRYVHSHYGILDRSDFDQMVKLVEGFLLSFGAEDLEKLRHL